MLPPLQTIFLNRRQVSRQKLLYDLHSLKPSIVEIENIEFSNEREVEIKEPVQSYSPKKLVVDAGYYDDLNLFEILSVFTPSDELVVKVNSSLSNDELTIIEYLGVKRLEVNSKNIRLELLEQVYEINVKEKCVTGRI